MNLALAPFKATFTRGGVRVLIRNIVFLCRVVIDKVVFVQLVVDRSRDVPGLIESVSLSHALSLGSHILQGSLLGLFLCFSYWGVLMSELVNESFKSISSQSKDAFSFDFFHFVKVGFIVAVD